MRDFSMPQRRRLINSVGKRHFTQGTALKKLASCLISSSFYPSKSLRCAQKTDVIIFKSFLKSPPSDYSNFHAQQKNLTV